MSELRHKSTHCNHKLATDINLAKIKGKNKEKFLKNQLAMWNLQSRVLHISFSFFFF